MMWVFCSTQVSLTRCRNDLCISMDHPPLVLIHPWSNVGDNVLIIIFWFYSVRVNFLHNYFHSEVFRMQNDKYDSPDKHT
jgi:hypothetical protein